MLTTSLLRELEDGWLRQHASLVDHLRPGLTAEEITRITGPLDLQLPDEARTWWAWHDGASAAVPFGAAREIGPGLAFLPLEEAVALYRHAREQASQVAGERADYWWRPTWFPIAERRGEIRCECAVPNGTASPIYWAYSHDHDAKGLTEPRVDSFGTMVRWWIDALQTGAWSYDGESHRWTRNPDLIPAAREQSGLV